MFDEKKDNNNNIYLIYVLTNINIISKKEEDNYENREYNQKLKKNIDNSIESEDIKNFIQIKNFECNYENKDIYLSYIEDPVEYTDYRLFENRLGIQKIIEYNNIKDNTKYSCPIIIFSKNKDTIINNNNNLIPDKETYGVIGE
jgi:hypothetical protein